MLAFGMFGMLIFPFLILIFHMLCLEMRGGMRGFTFAMLFLVILFNML